MVDTGARRTREAVRSPGGRAPAPVTPGSAPLAIASVTAVLRDLLANGLIRYSHVTRLGDVNVSVLPPDRITAGADEPNQLNLFMYGVAPHATLTKSRHDGPDRDGETERPALALDLRYLLTAYGAQDFHTEILLGCAVHLLSGVPVLTPDIVRDTLQPALAKGQKSSMSPARAALATSGVLESAGRLHIRQQFMTFEEMSKLWSALQARYRPSVAYEVSAVRMSFDG